VSTSACVWGMELDADDTNEERPHRVSPGIIEVNMNTKNTQSEGVKAKMALLLNARLADLIDFFTQTKHAHWNVRGPGFIAVHELFDRVA